MPTTQQVAPIPGRARFSAVTPLDGAGWVSAYGVVDFPRYITAQIDDPKLGYEVVLHVNTTEDGSSLSGIQLAPRPGQALSDVNLPSVITVARQLKAEPFLAVLRAAVVLDRQGYDWREVGASDEQGASLRADVMQYLESAQKQRSRPYRRRQAGLLEQVARVYVKAVEDGEPPTKAVQMRVRPPNGYSTAASWVQQARKAGLIGPALKGRAGWEDGS